MASPYPAVGLDELLELRCARKPLYGRHVVDVEDSVQVVYLMLQRTGKIPTGGDYLRTVLLVEILARHLRCAIYRTADTWEAQAPLLVALASLAGDYLWIEEYKRHRND